MILIYLVIFFSTDMFYTIAVVDRSILPDKITCGPLIEQDKVVGGDVAELDEFPWLVRIKYARKDGSETFACAGSLITRRHIVTAAHCCVVKNITIIGVRFGDLNRGEVCSEKSCQPVDVKVDKIILYPGYESSFRNDIAILLLQSDVNFTDFIRPVCLPYSEFVAKQDYEPNGDYWTAGWGQTETEIKSSSKRKISLSAVPMTECRAVEMISKESAPLVICAGGEQGVDSCKGDSGGGLVKLMFEDNSHNWFLFGVTSYGYKDCGTKGRPGLYTRVTRYMGWILRNIV